MTLAKTCAKDGCKSQPVFGFGLPSRGIMKWACRAHRDLIWIAVPHRAATEGGRGLSPDSLRPPSPSSRQERLL